MSFIVVTLPVFHECLGATLRPLTIVTKQSFNVKQGIKNIQCSAYYLLHLLEISQSASIFCKLSVDATRRWQSMYVRQKIAFNATQSVVAQCKKKENRFQVLNNSHSDTKSAIEKLFEKPLFGLSPSLATFQFYVS